MQRVLFYVEEQAQKCHLLQFSMLFFKISVIAPHMLHTQPLFARSKKTDSKI